MSQSDARRARRRLLRGSRPADDIDPDTGITDREKELLDVLASMHREFGLTASFTNDALAAVTGEQWAGSAVGLALRGLVVQDHAGHASVGYKVTEKGWAVFAGVDEELAEAPEPML
jgi:hypothetical protein